jgi:hypothetical protein
MTPTEAARIVDKPTAHTRQRLPSWGEPEVGGYAAAITTVDVMTTPTIMIERRRETRRL